MISDVLSDAVHEMNKYLTNPATASCYRGATKRRVLSVMTVMNKMREELDALPVVSKKKMVAGK